MSYKRKQGDNKRYRRLYKTACNGYPWPIWEESKPNKKKYFVRYWKSDGKNSCWAWNKKYGRRHVRRKYKNSEEKIPYTKCFDLWWNVY